MANSENSKGSARKSAALFHDAALGDLQALAQVPNARARRKERRTGWGHKNVVLTLVERGGSARSFHKASRASG